MHKRSNLSPAAAALAIVALLAMAAPARAATCDGVSFADSVKVGGTTLTLNGMGIRKATFMEVKVYVAGLYVAAKSDDAEAIAGSGKPWELVLHLARDVDASDMKGATEKGFKRSAGDQLDTLQARIDALTAQMTDLKKGDVFAYDYDPGTGTVLSLNGTAKGTPIKGDDFAKALLLATIGQNQPDAGLRQGLLGGTCH